ncbi:hypothetical protein [Actinomadura parmotrematis]|uniref:Uncharacterized protein n=1 Tax=Actinomadura parmotrematis TaxID=2864039 RepID=A0ABS7FTG7_9ACTN|nr:hypothetical protein [Actinomadura parmotrematis]MBW8483667.1 hypothetical protein [Actinomadura parmotrematis]
MTVEQHTGHSDLSELRAAYREQLAQLTAERDEARGQAHRARAEAVTARADLARVNAKVEELFKIAGVPREDGRPASDHPG